MAAHSSTTIVASPKSPSGALSPSSIPERRKKEHSHRPRPASPRLRITPPPPQCHPQRAHENNDEKVFCPNPPLTITVDAILLPPPKATSNTTTGARTTHRPAGEF